MSHKSRPLLAAPALLAAPSLLAAMVMGAGLLAAPHASAADLSSAPHRPAARHASAVHRSYIVCPDTYCGQRAYADPYIWDGFRGSKGYLGPEHYGRSWYLLKTMRPVYVAVADHPGYPQIWYEPTRKKTHSARKKHRTGK